MCRAVNFGCAQALETQSINLNGARVDKVLNLGAYNPKPKKSSEESKDSEEKNSVDNNEVVLAGIVTILKAHQKNEGVKDKKIAEYIRQILNNESIDFKFNAENRKFPEFLANLTYLLFFTEPARHPSCWITHQMMIDLIIAGQLTWKEALTKTMPVHIAGATPGARWLASQFKESMPRDGYGYQGPENQLKGQEIAKAEYELLTLWLGSFHCDKFRTASDIIRLIESAVQKKWYMVELPVVNNNVEYKENSVFERMRNHGTKKLEAQEAAPKTPVSPSIPENQDCLIFTRQTPEKGLEQFSSAQTRDPFTTPEKTKQPPDIAPSTGPLSSSPTSSLKSGWQSPILATANKNSVIRRRMSF